jgi:DNA invertase Pin-like site-specific DNA recombinase
VWGARHRGRRHANGDTAADAFMRTILDGAAAYERALIRSRTRAALAAKRAKGERVGTVPSGSRRPRNGALVANPGEQAAIAEARALRASGLTVRAVADALRAKGITSRKGRPLGASQVHAILSRAA